MPSDSDVRYVIMTIGSEAWAQLINKVHWALVCNFKCMSGKYLTE